MAHTFRGVPFQYVSIDEANRCVWPTFKSQPGGALDLPTIAGLAKELAWADAFFAGETPPGTAEMLPRTRRAVRVPAEA